MSDEKVMCSDGVERTKQELFEMMPLLRWDSWEYVHTPDGYRWRQRDEQVGQ